MRWLMLIVVAMSGCASAPEEPATIVSIGAPERAAAGMTSYAWRPDATIAADDALRAMTASAIGDALGDRGYVLVDADQADRHIAFAIGLTTELEGDAARAFGFEPGHVDESHGMLLIAFVDPRTGTPLYRAGIEARVRPGASDRARRQRIRDAVDILLAGVRPRS